MRLLLLMLAILLSNATYGKKYNLKLSFVDGYTNKQIINEKVTIKILESDWSKDFITDSTGSVEFQFKADHFIQYNFRFESDDYQFQTRQRYLFGDGDIEISFELYPSEEYESRILELEKKIVDELIEEPDSIDCLKITPEELQSMNSYVDNNMQVPYWFGDYGWKIEYLVQVTLDPTGKPLLIEIIESSDDHLIMEIIRLVRLMPNWKRNNCDGEYKKTVQFPLIIDHSTDE